MENLNGDLGIKSVRERVQSFGCSVLSGFRAGASLFVGPEIVTIPSVEIPLPIQVLNPETLHLLQTASHASPDELLNLLKDVQAQYDMAAIYASRER